MTSNYMDLNSQVDLYDSELLAIERGPLKYAQDRVGKMLDIDRFTRDLKEQFEHIGLGVEVQVHTTAQEGVWAFKVEIQRRLLSAFDHDQMVHEVTHNILQIPGAPEGFIDTNKGMKDVLAKNKARKHGHG